MHLESAQNRAARINCWPYSSKEKRVLRFRKGVEEKDAERARTASKPVKLQRPGEGRRVQSLLADMFVPHPEVAIIRKKPPMNTSVKTCNIQPAWSWRL